MLEHYLNQLDLSYFELGEAFKGLKDENVWRRPAENVLSVGEIAGHIAYWATLRLVGDGGWEVTDKSTEWPDTPVRSPLISHRFRYQTYTIQTAPSDEQRAMTAEAVGNEVQRVHKEVIALFKERNTDIESQLPNSPWPNFTYAEALKYQAFHVAYHTGQIYLSRHLLCEETVDN